MKIAVMQPYFFPYLGYWQLINHVDCFVVFDDVNYIKRGWINRNRILSEKKSYINLPLLAVSQNKLINAIEINQKDLFSRRLSAIIHETYRNAPFYDETHVLLEKSLYLEKKILSYYLYDQIKIMCVGLGIETEIVLSSDIPKKEGLKGQDKILAICKKLGADEYINPIGGIDLYSGKFFVDNGVQLCFLKSKLTPYEQFGGEFIPALSIIDVLAFNGITGTRKMLDDYEIINCNSMWQSLKSC
ncbi:WbqC family protein [Butyrivibrio sp. VCB2006]|uniref:WbqC family protein n=1 Tax=Butyrivibrio sp. VCB2006 TaxID=1280679 RepID=UPI0003FDA085|nr:WbqC family protein [Butyrivibrio sp. VCB2006]